MEGGPRRVDSAPFAGHHRRRVPRRHPHGARRAQPRCEGDSGAPARARGGARVLGGHLRDPSGVSRADDRASHALAGHRRGSRAAGRQTDRHRQHHRPVAPARRLSAVCARGRPRRYLGRCVRGDLQHDGNLCRRVSGDRSSRERDHVHPLRDGTERHSPPAPAPGCAGPAVRSALRLAGRGGDVLGERREGAGSAREPSAEAEPRRPRGSRHRHARRARDQVHRGMPEGARAESETGLLRRGSATRSRVWASRPAPPAR